MAKKKETTDSEIENEELEADEEEVDPSQEEDETEDDSDDDSEDEDAEETDDDDEEDEDEDSEEDEDDDEDFKKRFTQFKGDEPKEYLQNLEDGYAESSKEAVKLSRENKTLKETVERINSLIAANPELAKQLQEVDGTTKTGDAAQPPDPALSWAQTQMMQTWEKEYKDFTTEHPELETDPQLADKVDSQLGIIRDVIWKSEKRQLGMAEGLEMAWKILGKDTDNKEEKVRMAAKASASQGKASGGKKSKAAKPKFSEAQINVAMDMMNVDRETAIKQLSEHVK